MFKTPSALMNLALLTGLATSAYAQPAILHSDNPQWHAPASGLTATWVGDDAAADAQTKVDPSITLNKQAIQRAINHLRIQSDARILRITAGSRVTDIAIEPDQLHLLTLDGQEDAPALFLNRQEQFRNRGGWIGILWRSQEANITLTFVGATYVNLSFPATAAGVAPASNPQVNLGAAPVASTPSPAFAPAPVSPAVVTPQAAVTTPSEFPQDTRQAIAPATNAQPAQTNAAVPQQPVTGQPIIVSTTGNPSLGPARQYAPAPGTYPSLIEPENTARFNFNAGVDFLSGHFYRGMARAQGRLVAQPWVDSTMRIYGGPEHKDEILNSVHLTFGARTSHIWGDPFIKEDQDERWFDLNWRGGVELQVFDRWRIGAEYENVENIRTSWRDVHQFNAYVKFDDSDPNYSWSLQPYLLFSYEYEKQSDAGFLSRTYYDDRRFKSGLYMEAGVRPEFEVFKISGKPARLSLPVVLGVSLHEYFQDTNADDSWFGYVDIGANLNLPLWSMPTDSGSRELRWSLDLGVHTLILGSTVRDINQAAGAGDDDVQVIGKVGLKFNY